MRRTLVSTLYLIGAFLLGAVIFLFAQHHPLVTAADLGNNTTDAKAALRICKLYATWPVELKPGESLQLERRVCPIGFHKGPDDDWPSGAQHQILLLESHSWWHTKIVSALFSDLEFSEVELGKTQEGLDAVLWSYYIKCGSCHGGPEGVLAWSATSNIYLWNEHWIDSFSNQLSAKLPEGGYSDNARALSWMGALKELAYEESVYGPGDPHCCPTNGRISAPFVISDGRLKLNGAITYSPSH